MHHPGPPRFTTVGAPIELAPRDPDPDATYRWTIDRSPPDSSATLGDDPVEHLDPDVPGTYHVTLAAPDGTHDLTIRALDASLRPGDVDGVPAGYSGDAATDDAVTTGTRPDPFAAGRSGGSRERLQPPPETEFSSSETQAHRSRGNDGTP